MVRYIGVELETHAFLKMPSGSYEQKFAKEALSSLKTRLSRNGTPHRSFIGLTWTKDGIGFYPDEDFEVEFFTPPSSIDRGVGSRVANMLSLGVNTLVESSPFTHVGYSAHWNVSSHFLNAEDILRYCFIPLQCFGQTSRSKGIKARAEKQSRVELFTDGISDYNQVSALGAMIGASVMCLEDGLSLPYHLRESFVKDHRIPNTFLNHKEGVVELDSGFMSARDILKLHYLWLRPTLDDIASEDELEIIEEFVSGKELIVEKPIFADKYCGGKYLPGTIMDLSFAKTKVEPEGKSAWTLASDEDTLAFRWDSLRRRNPNLQDRDLTIDDVHLMYRLAKELEEKKVSPGVSLLETR